MNVIRLSLASLRFHALTHAFNIAILALGIAIIVTLLQVSAQIEQRFERDLDGIDLVVGAKGSPLQLILSSVFHLDVPTGNIPLKQAEALEANPLVKAAIPLALGDSYHGLRIVGTTPAYAAHYHASFTQGGFWTAPMQVVLGSEAARASGLGLGHSFAGSHGLTEGGEEHSAFPYKVVGILAPTGSVIDRLILTDVGSVWNVHEHDSDEPHAKDKSRKEREITALLITYKSPLAMAVLPRLVNTSSAMQAAAPALEMARLLHMAGLGGESVEAFGAMLAVIAALGFFITLFSAVSERRHDIALMRTLGATRRKVVAFVLMEGMTLGILGTALGIALGHALSFAMARYVENSRHIALPGIGLHPLEGDVILIALGISAAVAIIPAWRAYRVNVADILSKT